MRKKIIILAASLLFGTIPVTCNKVIASENSQKFFATKYYYSQVEQDNAQPKDLITKKYIMITIDKNNPLYNTVYVTGYPADKKENGNAVMYFCKGKTTGFSTDGIYAHNADTFQGESGSPIYIKKNGKYYVIGVHASGSSVANFGRAFTSYVTGYIKNKM